MMRAYDVRQAQDRALARDRLARPWQLPLLAAGWRRVTHEGE
jgi:hypothetical protein